MTVEAIEHMENPRAFVRELTRLARPGGWVVVMTPNQFSLLRKMSLRLNNEFDAFQNVSYPAHLTLPLEADLRRVGRECGWAEVAVAYTGIGRTPGTARHWWYSVSRLASRTLSDDVRLIRRSPADGPVPVVDRRGD